jgi:large subunit ribosomal protein L28
MPQIIETSSSRNKMACMVMLLYDVGVGDSGRICPFTDKKTNRANKVSFSNHKTKKQQFVNLQYKKLWWEEGKRFVKLRLSTKALKTIEKHGLDAVAKKAGIDLNKK